MSTTAALRSCVIRSFRDICQHRVSDRVVALRLQRMHRAEHVASLLVLTKLGLADETRDPDLESHNGRQHLVDERLRTIAHSPGLRLRRFVALREPFDETSKITFVVTHRNAPV